MIIIPGIAKCGTTYLTKKLHKSRHTMYIDPEKHYEDQFLMDGLIDIISNGKRGKTYDIWYKGEEFSKKQKSKAKWLFKLWKIKHYGVGMKNPRLIYFLDELFEVFPDAKYIFCMRNLNDWLKSNAKYERSGEIWKKHLLNYYNYCLNKIVRYSYKDIFVFNYDEDPMVSEERLSNYLGFEIDLQDFKPVTYQL